MLIVLKLYIFEFKQIPMANYIHLRAFIVALIWALPFTSLAQSSPYWQIMAEVSFKEQETQYRGLTALEPVFTEGIKELDHKVVRLDGYIYPLEGYRASKHFVLSALPISSCYFCGGGGPETVVEVYSSEPIPYSTDKISLRGVFILNADDPLGVIYQLKEAELIKK